MSAFHNGSLRTMKGNYYAGVTASESVDVIVSEGADSNPNSSPNANLTRTTAKARPIRVCRPLAYIRERQLRDF